MRVLVSAYACEPGQGSEPGVGWNFVCEMAKYHELWVLTQSDGRLEIEKELGKHPNPNLHFIFFDPFAWQLDLWKAKAEIQLHYYLWQVQAYFVAKSLHQTVQFDLIHHVTFVKYWGPSFLSLLDIPFLWGPVGGGESAPQSFWADFSLRGKVYESMRRLAQGLGELDPFTQATARRCVMAQATTEDTAKRLRILGTPKMQVVSGVGLSPQDLADLKHSPLPNFSPIRFVSIGRLLHWKGFHLSLKAYIKANLPDTEYWIIGDGPERERLQEIAQKSSLSNQIKFWGKMPRQEVLDKLSMCHVMLHPSLHDSGGWACLEAMAVGRPVICFDLGGPGVQVTDSTGIKIKALTPQQAIHDFAAAMIHLSKENETLVTLGKNSRERVETCFSWENKVKVTAELYAEIVKSNQHLMV